MTPGTHAEERPHEDAVRTQSCASQKERPQKPPNLWAL